MKLKNKSKYELIWKDDLNHKNFPVQQEFFTNIKAAKDRMKELVSFYKSASPCGFGISLWSLTADAEGKVWSQYDSSFYCDHQAAV